MISFSANVLNALSQETIEAFYMVRILNYDSSIMHSTTNHFADIQLKNNGVDLVNYSYPSDATLITVDPPQMNTNVDREQYKITLADPTLSKLAAVRNNLVGKTLEGRLGFINLVTGLPYLEIADCPIVYKGRIDGISYLIKTSEIGENLLQITGSSPMRNLDLKKSLFLSRDSIREKNVNDSSCDQIYEGSGAITLKWGKI
jgi:hypothetical protein